MARDQEKSIPLCPLMSVGSQVEIVCMQENCAWYLKNYKICSVYMMAHNSMLDVQAKQAKARQAQQNPKAQLENVSSRFIPAFYIFKGD